MDPLAAVITMLRPRAVVSKLITGAGRWGVRYPPIETAGFGLVLGGECWLSLTGAPFRLVAGDFVLMPSTPGFAMTSHPDAAPAPIAYDPLETVTALRHGDPDGAPDFTLLGGYFQFESANTALLADLLPALVHIRATDAAATRLAATIELIADEAMSQRPGRDLVVDRLVEILLVEALRFPAEKIDALARPGLLAGLADPQLARALRAVHADVARTWTVAELAREAGLSRSSFSERFTQTVGAAPMEYLSQWRMALAKDMLQRERVPLETVAERIGYQSASAFSTAFKRQVGRAPRSFARAGQAAGPT
jgi:AraC-like DNA-binding protein